MIRVAILTDVRFYREGLAQVLGRRSHLQVVATASVADEILGALSPDPPDALLVDMGLAGSLDVARRIAARAPQVKMVALAVAEVEQDVIACAEAGIAGFVPPDGSLDDLVKTIDAAVRGEVRCSPRITGTLFHRVAALSAHAEPAVRRGLTAREREIVQLIDRGCSNKDIARALGIEVATVKNHVHNILEKLAVQRRGEAAASVRGARLERLSGAHG